MVNDLKVLRKKALCGVFCGRDISKFNNLEFRSKRFCLIPRSKFCMVLSFSELQKEERGEERILNLESFSLKYKTVFKILY